MSTSKGRVLIAGGSGLIGRALVDDLAGNGYEVVVLSRNPDRVSGLPAGARAAEWDADTTDGWKNEVDGALAIVNLAGESVASGRWTEERKRRILDSRLDATGAVVSACRAVEQSGGRPPSVLLQGSAVGYYGPGGDRVLTEESPEGQDFLADVAVRWEAASEPVEGLGVRRVLLRTGVVLSSSGGVLEKMALPFKFFVGGKVGGGDQWVPWIHLHDEVRAIRFLLETQEARGPFNLVAPEPVQNAELSRRLAAELSRPSWMPAPSFALRLILGEMADLLLTGQRAVPEALATLGFSFRFPDLATALADLDL